MILKVEGSKGTEFWLFEFNLTSIMRSLWSALVNLRVVVEWLVSIHTLFHWFVLDVDPNSACICTPTRKASLAQEERQHGDTHSRIA